MSPALFSPPPAKRRGGVGGGGSISRNRSFSKCPTAPHPRPRERALLASDPTTRDARGGRGEESRAVAQRYFIKSEAACSGVRLRLNGETNLPSRSIR